MTASRKTRATIRATLPAHLDQLQRTLSLARGALDGPDPEAAHGFLDVLGEHLAEVPRPGTGDLMLGPVFENLGRALRDSPAALAHLLMARAALTDAINAQDRSAA